MKFCPDRLIQLRTSLNITKSEAARRLNISAMAYGRYEKGEREPSYQTVCFIAQTFGSNIDFLYGITSDPSPDTIQINASESPLLFELIKHVKNNPVMQKRLLAYAEMLMESQKELK